MLAARAGCANAEPSDAPRPVWSVALDAHADFMPAALAREGLVVAATPGGVCAFAAATGTKRWCARGAVDAAYDDGVVAYATRAGDVRALVARTGRELWNAPLAARAPFDERDAKTMWLRPGRSSFLVDVVDVRRRADSYAELRAADGRTLWHSRLPGASGLPVTVGSHAMQRVVGSGATMVFELRAIALGPAGGPRWTIPDGDSVLGGDARTLVATIATRDLRPPEVFARVDVALVDVLSQRILHLPRVTPDPHWADRAQTDRPITVHAAAHELLVTYGSTLYRYRIDGSKLSAPSAIPHVDEYLGMAGSAMIVRRPDGIWLMSRDGSPRAAWRATGDASAVVLSSGDRYVFVTRADGSPIAVDVRTRRTTVFPPCRSDAAVQGGDHVAFVCRERTDRRMLTVYALPRH